MKDDIIEQLIKINYKMDILIGIGFFITMCASTHLIHKFLSLENE